ncbi:MAG TPA: copper transporter [Trebonia sp.]|nr:copper transporter [Trebonia sp.]
MIDFRYHLVSIVAVFLALAIGIVLGSTELQGNTIDVLRTSSNLLKNELDQSNAERNTAQQENQNNQTFLGIAEPRLVANELPRMRVVLITEPGANSTVITQVTKAAKLAGATVTGQVAIQPKFNDLSGTTQSSLSQINADLASTDGTPLATPSNQQTFNQQQAAQLIGTAILATTTAGETTGISTADATTLLAAYAQAGYITITPAVTDRATLAVVVTPDAAPSDGQNDPATQVLLAMAQEFAAASAATVVVGSTAGSSSAGSAIGVLRASSVASLVSSVDNADSVMGAVSTIWALQDQLGGGKPNSYGISGASAISPVPSTVPSATPTISPSPHATKTGKGNKSVKQK